MVSEVGAGNKKKSYIPQGMRIVSGSLGGRVIQAPPGTDTRPTSEKVRQAIFNILPDLSGATVLDLFAGSGALGLEAISRGAEHVTFVEKSRKAAEVLKANIAKLRADNEADVEVVVGDALKMATRPLAKTPYMLVFLDPPYKSDLALNAARILDKLDYFQRFINGEDAIVVIEHDDEHVPPEKVGSLLRTDQRTYGDTMVSFFRKPS
jgi:16S rRNA (guanine966-N2)-methyltransferase